MTKRGLMDALEQLDAPDETPIFTTDCGQTWEPFLEIQEGHEVKTRGGQVVGNYLGSAEKCAHNGFVVRHRRFITL